ncbi:LysR substrate-binding domain-containing protein [Saccharopolyspora sp. NPDC050642]|uniref:LysR substrate-binding domain-containing protein n=1 Tax=Saccharopolyspora sp. NPDC050642 TaxID=3157099 RepID=UPI0033C240DD
MELRHLRYFVAVAETRHFGRAAKRLNMAQPPLSQAIRQLEAELGAELFARTTRQVQLTPAGAVFHDDALRILKSIDDAARRVKRLADGRHGVLRLGLTGSASYRQLPRLAHIVKRDLPGVELEIHPDLLTPAQEKALLRNEIDVGMLRPPTREDRIAHRTIAREPLVLVLPENHPLAGEPEVGMARLRAEQFIMYSASLRSVVNDAVVRSCLAAGFYPNCAHEIGEASTQVALVAAGLGVALAPASVQAFPLEGVVFVPVPDAESVELALAWRAEDDSPLLRNLLTTLAANDVFVCHDDIQDIEEAREDHAN